jgi:hypothetical protein
MDAKPSTKLNTPVQGAKFEVQTEILNLEPGIFKL